jgi:hypothetical protein
MPPSRHVLPLFAAIVAIVGGTRAAAAWTSDPVPAEDPGASPGNADAADAGADDAAFVAAMPATFVEISGAASGSLPSTAEARTTWRYGRTRGKPVDETSCRLRVSAAGRSLDGALQGLSVGFSIAILAPALRIGTYVAGTLPGVAGAWARQDRGSAAPDIEWDGSARDGGPPSFVVTVTSIAETAHSSERRGDVTIDMTDFRVHGAIEATLPCTRCVASLRQSCRAETIRGTF